ncbi:ParB/RepB/Spo0J family partition protein [Nocardia sp. NPDC059239]|uniref:ParB/RepB/Spo0J family partition protein n=1 Tax=unclassified Nocardia TaxID=2637762 RepID=UPI0036D087B1
MDWSIDQFWWGVVCSAESLGSTLAVIADASPMVNCLFTMVLSSLRSRSGLPKFWFLAAELRLDKGCCRQDRDVSVGEPTQCSDTELACSAEFFAQPHCDFRRCDRQRRHCWSKYVVVQSISNMSNVLYEVWLVEEGLMPQQNAIVDGGLLDRCLSTAGNSDLSPADVTLVPMEKLGAIEGVRVGGMNVAHVRALAESGADLPPIVVQRSRMRVIDGVHRLRAEALRGQTVVRAILVDVTDQEAFALAVRLNVRHGLPLSLADRKGAALRILRDCPAWSDRYVASVTGLSDKTVGSIRRGAAAEIPQPTERLARNGKLSRRPVVDGRLRAAELLQAQPRLPLRHVADEAGISLTTAKDVRSRLRRGDHPLPARQRSAEDGTAVRPEPGGSDGKVDARRADGLGEPDSAAPELMMQRLRRDPAVRLTEGGRWLLRWLDSTALDRSGCIQAISGLPEYHLHTVAQLARERSAAWLRMAESIERRAESARSLDIS